MKTENRIIWAILIVLIILSVGSLIFAVCLRVQMKKQQYEFKSIEAQINSLEKGIIGSENKELNVSDEKTSLAECGKIFTNAYDLDESLKQSLLLENDFSSLAENGYILKTACNSNGKNLYFFDSQKGFEDNAGKVSDDELNKIVQKANIAVADENDNAKLENFEVEIPQYRFEGTGSIACNFDNFSKEGNSIQYICYNASDSGTEAFWYSYNITGNENVLVKEASQTLTSEGTKGEIKEDVHEEKLLDLFNEKDVY